MAGEENSVKVVFEGEVYALQESTETAQGVVDSFASAVEEDLQQSVEDYQAAAADIDASNVQIAQSSIGSAQTTMQGFHVLSRSMLIMGRVFDEQARKNLMYIVSLGHMARGLGMLPRGVRILTESMHGLAASQLAVALTNPFTALMLGAGAALTALWFLANKGKESKEEAEKAIKDLEGHYNVIDGKGFMRNRKGAEAEADDELKKAEKKIAEAKHKYDTADDVARRTQAHALIAGIATGGVGGAVYSRIYSDSMNAEEIKKKALEDGTNAQHEALTAQHNKLNAEYDKERALHRGHTAAVVNALRDRRDAYHKAYQEAMVETEGNVQLSLKKAAIAEEKASAEADAKRFETLRKRRDAITQGQIELAQGAFGGKVNKLFEELGGVSMVRHGAGANDFMEDDATRRRRQQAQALVLDEEWQANDKRVAEKKRMLEEERKELGMSSADAARQRAIWDVTKDMPAEGNLRDVAAEQAASQFDEERQVGALKRARETNEAYAQQRVELGMTSAVAKRYAADEDALKKAGVDRESEAGKALVKANAAAEHMKVLQYIKDTNEAMDEQETQLGMTAEQAKQYAKEQEALHKLGLDRGDADAQLVLRTVRAQAEVEHQTALKQTLDAMKEEELQLRMSADAYRAYQEAKKAGLEGDKEAMRKIQEAQDNVTAQRMKNAANVPGLKEFKEELERIDRLMKAGRITENEGALAMKAAEDKFAPNDYRASLGGVAETWGRMQTNLASPQDQQLKATKDLAHKIEDKMLGKDVHAQLLRDIPIAIREANQQLP
jgi:hypothetical protein